MNGIYFNQINSIKIHPKNDKPFIANDYINDYSIYLPKKKPRFFQYICGLRELDQPLIKT